jgi:hypothetical protein
MKDSEPVPLNAKTLCLPRTRFLSVIYFMSFSVNTQFSSTQRHDFPSVKNAMSTNLCLIMKSKGGKV